MNTIQVNYDLGGPVRNYPKLYRYLNGFESARPLESLWLIRTSKTASQVRDDCNGLVDDDDEVLVFNVTGDWWASNFSDASTDWLHQYMGVARAA